MLSMAYTAQLLVVPGSMLVLKASNSCLMIMQSLWHPGSTPGTACWTLHDLLAARTL